MADELQGVRVAVLVSDGFEQVELDDPVAALRRAGARVDILAEDEAHLDEIKGMNHLEPGEGTRGDRLLEEADPDDYDALFIPGGLASPDTMRQSEEHLEFVAAFFDAGKPVAAICHAPWLLADAGVLGGVQMTSWPGIQYDMVRAGADWVDEEVVVDEDALLVTSRKPEDIPAFAAEAIRLFADATARVAP
jgi:protease I